MKERADASRKVPDMSLKGRIKHMFGVIAVPNGTAVALIVVVALASVLLAGQPLAWLPTIIAESWMVMNLAPVNAGGISLSMVPLLPAIMLFTFVAYRVHAAIRKRVSVRDLLILVGWVLGIPLILTLIAAGMLWDAGRVYDVAPPGLPLTLARVVLLHLSAMAVGMGPRLWRALARRYNVPTYAVDAALAALRFLGLLAAAGAVVLVVLFAAGWDRQEQLIGAYPQLGAGGVTGLVLISLAYLPNAVIAAAAVLAGADFVAGGASVSLFDIHLVPLPPVPLLGVIPGAVAPWAVGLMVVPAAAAIAVQWRARAGAGQVLATAGWAGLFSAILVFFVSGELGYFGFSGPTLWLAVALVFAWVAVPGLAIAAGLAWAARRARAGVPELEPEPVPEPADAPEPEAEVYDLEGVVDGEVVDADTAATEKAADTEAAESAAEPEDTVGTTDEGPAQPIAEPDVEKPEAEEPEAEEPETEEPEAEAAGTAEDDGQAEESEEEGPEEVGAESPNKEN